MTEPLDLDAPDKQHPVAPLTIDDLVSDKCRADLKRIHAAMYPCWDRRPWDAIGRYPDPADTDPGEPT